MPREPGVFGQDLYNPLGEFIRGVEADVLFILTLSETGRSGSDIARWAQRSKAEVHKVLYWLQERRIVNSERQGTVLWWWLNADHPATRPIMKLCVDLWNLDKSRGDIPYEFAKRLKGRDHRHIVTD